jgi:hypothetical protein
MAATMNTFRHGGQRLNALTHHEYQRVLSAEKIREMVLLGTVHHAGLILCSQELCGLVHLPPPAVLQACDGFTHTLDGPEPSPTLTEGTPLGVSSFAGASTEICISPKQRFRHTHAIGKSDRGKSTLLLHMGLHDARGGDSLIVMDPHGDLVNDLLLCLPEEAVARTIVFDPGDPEYVALWNPLMPVIGQDPARTAGDLTCAIKSVSTDWGDRLDRLIKCTCHGIQHVPGCCFQDISAVLTPGNKRGQYLVAEFLKRVTNADARSFWLHEFSHFNKNELTAPKNKLSKLLLTGTVGKMLSQPDSAINLREVMDNGHILLVNLSNVGMEVRSILGAFLLALIHTNALNRATIPKEKRRPVHVICDEAHLFVVSEKIQELLSETRKYKVSLTLAHQFLAQFQRTQQNALGTVGTTVIFEVNDSDAATLAHHLYGEVEADELIRLETGHAVVRVGGHVARIQTPEPPPVPEISHRDEIIERSRRLYYRKAEDIRAAQARDGQPAAASVLPPDDRSHAGGNPRESGGAPGRRAYDTF